MKKPILLLFLAAGCIATSCKSDDSGEDGDLMGTWSYIAYIDSDGEEPSNDCESMDILRFKDGNVFDYEFHSTDNSNGDCIEGTHNSGSWTYLFNRKVQLDYGLNGDSNITIAKYKVSGDILTLTIDEDNGEYQEKYRKN
ncbi:lipocalin family protein [Zobellia alginiliquefaciens]|uniref:lipocalin family protein n=1 Tax=Zobellia alginiliquefaciens TaxID=3032586 RepID=UPI0023E46B9F|nr:lipocalin family protein [Zobellia alginiliquefaciens]